MSMIKYFKSFGRDDAVLIAFKAITIPTIIGLAVHMAQDDICQLTGKLCNESLVPETTLLD